MQYMHTSFAYILYNNIRKTITVCVDRYDINDFGIIYILYICVYALQTMYTHVHMLLCIYASLYMCQAMEGIFLFNCSQHIKPYSFRIVIFVADFSFVFIIIAANIFFFKCTQRLYIKGT